MNRHWLVFLVLCLLPVIAAALPGEHGHVAMEDTVERAGPDDVAWYTESALFGGLPRTGTVVDTTIARFHHYDFHEDRNYFYAGKGNVGHAVRMLRFDPEPAQGFRTGTAALYPGYLFSPDSIRYYRPAHVFSELYYVLGTDREQLFQAMHNQRLHERVYGGLAYMTVNSPAPYFSRLRSRNANFRLYIEGEPADRYHVGGSFVMNRIINHESGGLKDREAFEEDEVRDSVFFYHAETRIRETAFRVQQSYRFGPSGDSPAAPGQSLMSSGRIRHVFTYKRRSLVFDDPAEPLRVVYPGEVPHYSGATYDSTVVHTVSNQLGWSNQAITNEDVHGSLHIHVFAKHQFIQTQLPRFVKISDVGEMGYAMDKARYNQIKSGIRLQSDPSGAVSFASHASYIAGGYNDQDYAMGATVYLGKESRVPRISLRASVVSQEAPYFMQRYRSNYVSWDNRFDKTRTLQAGLGVSLPGVFLHASYAMVDRPVFMHADGYPGQVDQSVSVLSGGLSSGFRVGAFRSQHVVLAQYVSEEWYERFPPLLSYHAFYANLDLFDNALQANAGFDVRYNSPYKPMAYMPVVRQFYIQDQYKSDHEVLANVFVNAMIGRARLFVKFKNVLGLLSDRPPVYDIPFYPLPETMFAFGISWMFFD